MGNPSEPVPQVGSVTVIIPTRNRPGFLRAAVASVLEQTRPVNEIIVVDDGSDGAEWLRQIESMSPIIEIIRRKDCSGPAAARNHGLARAHGEFLLFLDDDDLVDPRFVETGLAQLAAHPDADGVFFRYRIIHSTEPWLPDEANASSASCLAATGNPTPRAMLEARPASAFMRYLLPIHSGFIRHSALGTVRFPEQLRQGEDTYFWIALAAAGSRLVLDEHPYAVVRRHAGNTTRSRIRYRVEIQPCYEKLLADHLLTDPEDRFLAHLKLLLFKLLTGKGGAAAHVERVICSPRLLVHELRFWLGNLQMRLTASTSTWVAARTSRPHL